MNNVSLEKLQEQVIELQQEMEYIRELVEEEYELADDVKEEIAASRKRPKTELISNKKVMKEFGLK